eukprot:c31861_g1_i1 orf=104-277(-)
MGENSCPSSLAILFDPKSSGPSPSGYPSAPDMMSVLNVLLRVHEEKHQPEEAAQANH